MPIIKSAKKRVRTTRKATARNSKTKRALRSAVKVFQKSVAAKDAKKMSAAFKNAQSEIDKAGKKNIMHKNKVARKKSQLAKVAKAAAASAKPATAKTVKKPAAKKTATVKTTKAKK
ncbi:MAG TPA: 30S ribosomal protein S20 [Patescibacteria group bacterium]|jgi:small subunit ribosomal protein S20|nr:30S ribosomal protein S20 [Patescibacteria group bacterium]